MNQDKNDICWSTILTDADLELVDPTNYTGQVVHSNVSDSVSLCSASRGVTTHLTAVEPHTLHLVTSSPTHTILDDTELFRNPHHASSSSQLSHTNNSDQLSLLNGSDIISATHNVVTCVNPSNQPSAPNSNHWNNWAEYNSHPAQASADSQQVSLSSHDLLQFQQIDKAVNQMSVPASNLFISVNESAYLNQSENHIIDSNNCQLIEAMSNEKPASGNSSGICFDSHSNLPPWIESKAVLEAAAFDLDQFDDIENCADF